MRAAKLLTERRDRPAADPAEIDLASGGGTDDLLFDIGDVVADVPLGCDFDDEHATAAA